MHLVSALNKDAVSEIFPYLLIDDLFVCFWVPATLIPDLFNFSASFFLIILFVDTFADWLTLSMDVIF